MGWQVSFALGSSGFLSVFSASASWAMVSGLSGPAVVGVEAPSACAGCRRGSAGGAILNLNVDYAFDPPVGQLLQIGRLVHDEGAKAIQQGESLSKGHDA